MRAINQMLKSQESAHREASASMALACASNEIIMFECYAIRIVSSLLLIDHISMINSSQHLCEWDIKESLTIKLIQMKNLKPVKSSPASFGR